MEPRILTTRTGSRVNSDSKNFRPSRPQFVKEDDLDQPSTRIVKGCRRKKEKPPRYVRDGELWAEHQAVLTKAGYAIKDLARRLLQ
jgi:hypothetical protein